MELLLCIHQATILLSSNSTSNMFKKLKSKLDGDNSTSRGHNASYFNSGGPPAQASFGPPGQASFAPPPGPPPLQQAAPGSVFAPPAAPPSLGPSENELAPLKRFVRSLAHTVFTRCSILKQDTVILLDDSESMEVRDAPHFPLSFDLTLSAIPRWYAGLPFSSTPDFMFLNTFMTVLGRRSSPRKSISHCNRPLDHEF